MKWLTISWIIRFWSKVAVFNCHVEDFFTYRIVAITQPQSFCLFLWKLNIQFLQIIIVICSQSKHLFINSCTYSVYYVSIVFLIKFENYRFFEDASNFKKRFTVCVKLIHESRSSRRSYAKRVQLLTFFLAKQSILAEFMSDSIVNRG